MSNHASPPMSRRGLLRMGLLAAALCASGCGEPGVSQVEKPSAQQGTRKRLDSFKETAERASTKKN
jgi:hypothetical protein